MLVSPFCPASTEHTNRTGGLSPWQAGSCSDGWTHALTRRAGGEGRWDRLCTHCRVVDLGTGALHSTSLLGPAQERALPRRGGHRSQVPLTARVQDKPGYPAYRPGFLGITRQTEAPGRLSRMLVSSLRPMDLA